jgi:BirA family biotin operon repressor/biotin-[acetyl-CoA-carboxylase] ligase
MHNNYTVIKLNAIDSTNTFLKQQVKQQLLQDFTLVYTNQQTAGRGQMGAVWVSEVGKSLTFSLLVKKTKTFSIVDFDFQILVSVAVYRALNIFKVESEIKWPNDIMAGGRKLGGILIEQVTDFEEQPALVVGIGINNKQTSFQDLPNATSLALNGCTLADDFQLISEIRNQIVTLLKHYQQSDPNSLRQDYLRLLMKYQKPAVYQANDTLFNAIIVGISAEGKLLLQHEDDSIKSYGLKEVKMMY